MALDRNPARALAALMVEAGLKPDPDVVDFWAARCDELVPFDPPCPVCGCEVRGQGGYLACKCPASPSDSAGKAPGRAGS